MASWPHGLMAHQLDRPICHFPHICQIVGVRPRPVDVPDFHFGFITEVIDFTISPPHLFPFGFCLSSATDTFHITMQIRHTHTQSQSGLFSPCASPPSLSAGRERQSFDLSRVVSSALLFILTHSLLNLNCWMPPLHCPRFTAPATPSLLPSVWYDSTLLLHPHCVAAVPAVSPSCLRSRSSSSSSSPSNYLINPLFHCLLINGSTPICCALSSDTPTHCSSMQHQGRWLLNTDTIHAASAKQPQSAYLLFCLEFQGEKNKLQKYNW